MQWSSEMMGSRTALIGGALILALLATACGTSAAPGGIRAVHRVWVIDTSGSSFCRGYFMDVRYGRAIRRGLDRMSVRGTYTFIAFDSRCRCLKSQGKSSGTAAQIFEPVKADLNGRIRAYRSALLPSKDGSVVFNPKRKDVMGTDLKGALDELEADLGTCGASDIEITFLTDGSWDPVEGSRETALKVISPKLEQIADRREVKRINFYGLTDDVSESGSKGGRTLWLQCLKPYRAKVHDLDWKD